MNLEFLIGRLMQIADSLCLRRTRFLGLTLLKLALLSLGAVSWAQTSTGAGDLPPEFSNDLVASGVAEPIDLAFTPDGAMLVLERAGRILRFAPSGIGAGWDAPTTYMELSQLSTFGERGLTSIALDPDFANNGYFYLYYHSLAANRARVSRFVDLGGHAHASDEFYIWLDPQSLTYHTSLYHWGGGMVFADDGTLLLAMGDKWNVPGDSQDLQLSAGKLIRLDPAGADSGGPWVLGQSNSHLIPADNPYVDGVGGNLDEIFASGLRNPFRMHADPNSDRIYISEVGGNVDDGPDASYEDLHVVRLSSAGVNYGWPICEGPDCTGTPPPGYSPPLFSLQHPDAPAMIVGPVQRSGTFPRAHEDVLFIFDHTKGWLRTLDLDAEGNVLTQTGSPGNAFAVDGTLGNPVAMQRGPDGALYYLDWLNSEIRRIAYNGGDQPPLISSTSSDSAGAPSPPVTIEFTGTATDPEAEPLDYSWDFGDGTTASGAVASHTYTEIGAFQAQLSVSDALFTVTSEPIEIIVGAPPVPSIDLFPTGLFRAGDVIDVVGSGTDPDQAIGLNDLRWTVRFLHDDHAHPFFSESPGIACAGPGFSCAQAVIPIEGHDFSGMTAFEIILTATDSSDLSASTSIVLSPDKVDMMVTTNVPGPVSFTLDQIGRSVPFTHDTLIGFKHTLTAPALVVSGGDAYQFASWTNGETTPTVQITSPDVDFTETALYVNTGPAGRTDQGLLALYRFDEGSGSVVADSSSYGAPLDLSIDNPGAVTWGDGSLTVDSPTRIASLESAAKIVSACKNTGSVSMELWAAPGSLDQTGPARIAGMSQDSGLRNITIGQGNQGAAGNFANMRLRTTATTNNGEPSTSGPTGTLNGGLQHIVFTRAANGEVKHYVDGQLVESSSVLGSLNNWTEGYAVVFANEADGSRPWLGTLGLVAFYDQVLSLDDVQQNFTAGNPGAMNTPPVANLDEFNTAENSGFLANVLQDNGHGIDYDPDGDSMTLFELNGTAFTPLTWTSLPSGARMQLMQAGWIYYDPNGAFDALDGTESAIDGFGYSVADLLIATPGAAVIYVAGVNNPPVIQASTERTFSELELLIEPINTSDVESNARNLELISGPNFVGLFWIQGQAYVLGYALEGNAGSYTVHLRSTDNGTPSQSSDHFLNLTVTPAAR